MNTSHCALTGGTETQSEASEKDTLILVGNPNVGKSVVFGYLTGSYVTVSNYPGTTVEITRGKAQIGGKTFDLIDSPGINNLTPMSKDEEVTRDILLETGGGASVIQISDMKNLDRGLLLTLQLAEMGIPQVLVMNMEDEAIGRGMVVNDQVLSGFLGIPCIRTTAIIRKGLREMTREIPDARVSNLELEYHEAIEGGVFEIQKLLPADLRSKRGLALMILAGDTSLQKWLTENLNGSLGEVDRIRLRVQSHFRKPLQRVIGETRINKVEDILSLVVRREKPSPQRFRKWITEMSTHPVWGYLLLGAVLYGIYFFVGLIGAGLLVDFLETVVFGQYINPWCIQAFNFLLPFPHVQGKVVSEFALNIPLFGIQEIKTGVVVTKEVLTTGYTIPPGTDLTLFQKSLRLVYDFFVGEYGAITMAISYGFAIVLPIVGTFFIIFSFLEDSGYLPRLAIMANRTFKTMGLNGKAVLPMVLGLGCDTMATMTTRILETPKERIIVTLLLALGVPCSAQLGVLLAMLASISFWGMMVWIVTVLGVMALVGYLSNKVVKGDSIHFMMEIPPIRLPQWGNIFKKTFARIEWYLWEVVPLFVLGTAVLFVLDRISVLGVLQDLANPVIVHFLGLPSQATAAFLIGFLRRDFGAVFLLDAARQGILDPTQILVSMVVITLFVPCIANVFMMIKEQGFKRAMIMVAFIFPFAIVIGGILNFLIRALHFPV